MGTTAIRILVVLVVLGTVVLEAVRLTTRQDHPKDPPPQFVPMSEAEVLASRALEDLRDGLAPIMTGQATEVLNKAYRLGVGEQLLSREAEKRLGFHVELAPVVSGSQRVGWAWVRR